MTYKLILAPEGAVIPDDLTRLVASDARNIVEKIIAGKEREVIALVSTTEIQLLVEYRHILDVTLRAIIGLQGTTYNTLWNTYVATMDRTTIDNLRTEVQDSNDAKSDAGNQRFTAFTPGERRPAGRLRLASADSEANGKADEEVGDVE